MEFPNGEPEIVINYTDPLETKFIFPFKIENSGYHNIQDIQVFASLKVIYTDKDNDKEKELTLLEDKSKVGTANIGESHKDSIETYYEDSEFNRKKFNKILTDADNDEDVIYVLRLEITFYIVGLEKDWIIFEINLSEEEEISTQNSSEDAYKSSFGLLNVAILLSLLSISLFGGHQQRRKPKTLKSEQISLKDRIIENKPAVFKVLRMVLFTSIFIFWYLISLELMLISTSEDIEIGDYLERYQFVTCCSIICLIIINILSVLPLVAPQKIQKYSISMSINSLTIKGIFIVNFTLWFLVSKISYILNGNIIIIQDTMPSLGIIIIFLSLNLFLGLIDAILTQINRNILLGIENNDKEKPNKLYPKYSERKVYNLKRCTKCGLRYSRNETCPTCS